MYSKYQINGLKLPEPLCRMLDAGTWTAPKNRELLRQLLSAIPTYQKEHLEDDVRYFGLYSFDLMCTESKHLQGLFQEKNYTMFLGQADRVNYPGDIDIKKTILFADLGLGSDAPFALDYRTSPPSVLLMIWGKNPIVNNRWVKVADSFDELAEKIGLTPIQARNLTGFNMLKAVYRRFWRYIGV